MPVAQSIAAFLVAFLVTYAMVPVSKRIAEMIGAIDFPGERRVNEQAVPRAGGIALYTGFMAGMLCLLALSSLTDSASADLYQVRGIDYVQLSLGVTIVFVVGLIDDVSPLSPRSKLAGQILAAAAICLSGVTIGTIRLPLVEGYLSLEWLDVPITIVYFLVFMNAINLIDGLDGLAAGIVGIASLGLMYLVAARGSGTMAVACLVVFACCLAFLRYNFYPASVFMGDSGSLFLGTVLAVLSVSGVARTQGVTVLIVPLVIAGVPVVDTATAIVRRVLEGRRIDQADMEHVHHRMLAFGMSHRRVVLSLYAITAVLTVAGCFIGSLSGVVRWGIIAGLAVAVALVIWRMHLFGPVLQHYYRRREKSEPRCDRKAQNA